MNGLLGMLWYDENPKSSAADKIKTAIDYYQKKYYQPATIVLVNPSAGEIKLPGVEIKQDKTIQKNHYFISSGDSANG